jgi:hypothetical protein
VLSLPSNEYYFRMDAVVLLSVPTCQYGFKTIFTHDVNSRVLDFRSLPKIHIR